MKPEDVPPELLDWLKTTAERSSEFVEREWPLLANEIVAWHFWSSVTAACLFAAISLSMAAIGCVLLRYWLVRPPIDRDSSIAQDTVTEGIGVGFCSLFVAAALIGFMGVSPNAYAAVKASVAPRVVVLEYVKGAVK